MDLIVQDVEGRRFLEGLPGQPLIERADNIGSVLETCFSQAVDRLLLYSENLPPRFFDLSSGEAGTILQKLRTYHIQLAVVCAPDQPLSQRFRELLADEQQGADFRLFETRQDAQAWLCGS